MQSGPPLASLTGQNFGFGYGQIQPVQVYTAQQASKTAESTCATTYGIPADKNGDHFCVTNVNPTVWLGTPDYLLQPTLNCNPASGLKANQFINPTCFGIPLARRPDAREPAHYPTNPTGQGVYRLPYIHGPGYVRNDLTLLKNFPVKEKQNLQLRLAAFNFLNHPLTCLSTTTTQTNLQLAFQGATVGKPLTVNNLTHQNFGIANIKYGYRARLSLARKLQLLAERFWMAWLSDVVESHKSGQRSHVSGLNLFGGVQWPSIISISTRRIAAAWFAGAEPCLRERSPPRRRPVTTGSPIPTTHGTWGQIMKVQVAQERKRCFLDWSTSGLVSAAAGFEHVHHDRLGRAARGFRDVLELGHDHGREGHDLHRGPLRQYALLPHSV